MKPRQSKILAELTDLLRRDRMDSDTCLQMIDAYQYEPLQSYLHSLYHHITPETAVHELMKAVTKDLLNIRAFPEATVAAGLVDVVLMQPRGNPVMAEFKSLFQLNPDDQSLQLSPLNYEKHIRQIKKYLLENEYVILTNLREMYLFNRDSLLTGQPFTRIDFIDFLTGYTGNIWDDIRNQEDQTARPDEEVLFLRDLKRWYDLMQQVNFKLDKGFEKHKLSALFLNRIIFIKTLEDLNLIPYKFIEDMYRRNEMEWYAKGYGQVFENFFAELEKWFEDYYGTELFHLTFWDYVDTEFQHVQHFRRIFNQLSGFGQWDDVKQRGFFHCNFRRINEDVYGHAWDHVIADVCQLSAPAGLPPAMAADSPPNLARELFQPQFESLLAALRQNIYSDARRIFQRIEHTRCIFVDSGCGSALVKLLREIYQLYQTLKSETDWADKNQGLDLFDLNPNIIELRQFREKVGLLEPRLLVSRVILRHIFASAEDPLYLDIAKVNLWREAVTLNEAAYRSKQIPGNVRHVLPDLRMNMVHGRYSANGGVEQQISVIQEEFGDHIRELHRIRRTYLANPFEPEILDERTRWQEPILQYLQKEFPAPTRSLFVVPEFFFTFFDKTGQVLPEEEQGFSYIINPL